MKAFVDSREPEDVKLKMAKGNANGDITFDTKELEQGDFYLPEHDVVVERKEASDFASSLTDGRLSEQADRMAARHQHVYLLLEGNPYQLKYSDVGSNSVVGMQTSLAVKRGVKIIFTDSMSETVYAVNRLFERFCDGELGEKTSHVKTHDTGEVEDTQLAMLIQIRGITEEKARIILSDEYYGDLVNLCGWIDTDATSVFNKLQEIDGVGEVLAQRVVDAFR